MKGLTHPRMQGQARSLGHQPRAAGCAGGVGLVREEHGRDAGASLTCDADESLQKVELVFGVVPNWVVASGLELFNNRGPNCKSVHSGFQ